MIHLEVNILEAFQVEAALTERLAKANEALPALEPGSPEAGMVDSEVRYTGSALTRLQELLYGTDEPDELPDLLGERAAHDEHERPVAGCAICDSELGWLT